MFVFQKGTPKHILYSTKNFIEPKGIVLMYRNYKYHYHFYYNDPIQNVFIYDFKIPIIENNDYGQFQIYTKQNFNEFSEFFTVNYFYFLNLNSTNFFSFLVVLYQKYDNKNKFCIYLNDLFEGFRNKFNMDIDIFFYYFSYIIDFYFRTDLDNFVQKKELNKSSFNIGKSKNLEKIKENLPNIIMSLMLILGNYVDFQKIMDDWIKYKNENAKKKINRLIQFRILLLNFSFSQKCVPSLNIFDTFKFFLKNFMISFYILEINLQKSEMIMYFDSNYKYFEATKSFYDYKYFLYELCSKIIPKYNLNQKTSNDFHNYANCLQKLGQEHHFLILKSELILASCIEDLIEIVRVNSDILRDPNLQKNIYTKFQNLKWENPEDKTFDKYYFNILTLLENNNHIYLILMCVNSFAFFLFISQKNEFHLPDEFYENFEKKKKTFTLNDIYDFENKRKTIQDKIIFFIQRNFSQKATDCLKQIEVPLKKNKDLDIFFNSCLINKNELLNYYLEQRFLEFSDEDFIFIFKILILPSIEENQNVEEVKLNLKNVEKILLKDKEINEKNFEGFSNLINKIYFKIKDLNIKFNEVKQDFEQNLWKNIFNISLKNIYFCQISNILFKKNQELKEKYYLQEGIDYIQNLKEKKIESLITEFIDKNINKIDCNNPFMEKFLTNYISLYSKYYEVTEENVKNKLIENINSKDFWYLILTSKQGNYNIKKIEYIKKLAEEIFKLYQKIESLQIKYCDIEKIYEMEKNNNENLQILINYFEESSKIRNFFLVKASTEQIKKNIIHSINYYKKIETGILFCITLKNYFGNLFDNESIKLLNKVEENIRKELFKSSNLNSLEIPNEIKNNLDDIEKFNNWKKSDCFMENFKIRINQISGNNNLNLKKVLQILSSMYKTMDKNYTKIHLNGMNGKIDIYFLKIYENLRNINKERVLVNQIYNNYSFNNSINITNLFNLIQKYNLIKRFVNFLISLINHYHLESVNLKDFKEFLSIETNQEVAFSILFPLITKIENNLESMFHNLYNENISDFFFIFLENNNLINFITKTNEDEITSMLDLIDDSNDNVVNIQIILNLIEIKSFLNSIKFNNNINENEKLQTFINKFTNILPGNIYKTGKLIKQCGEVFQEIKSLHLQIFDKEGSSIIKIKNIVNYSIVLIKENDIFIKYNKNVLIKLEELNELKARVQLFISTSEQKENEKIINTSFVNILNIINEIWKEINSLKENGYPENFNDKELTIESNETINLDNFLGYVKQLNKEWKEIIKKLYLNYYPLTLFYGKQVWELEKYFTNPDFYDIGFNLFSVFQKVNNLKYSISNSAEERLIELGKVLNSTIQNNIIDIFETKQKIDANEIPINLHKNIFPLIKHNQKIILASVEENDNLYQYIISIYLTFQNSFPKRQQILFCSEKVNLHILSTFLYRALLLKNENILFTLIEVELLSFSLQNYLLEFLNEFKFPYSLCFISIEKYSYIFNKLSEKENVYKIRSIEILDINSINKIIKNNKLLNSIKVFSDKEGNGKTYNIIEYKKDEYSYINIPIQDNLDIDDIIKKLYSINQNLDYNIKYKIHLDIHRGIKDFKNLNKLLFYYLFMNNILLEDSIYNCTNDISKDLIFIEISNEIDTSKILLLQFINEEMQCEFNENLFIIPKETNNLKYKHLIYLMNYLNYQAENILNEEDVIPNNVHWKIDFSNEEVINLLHNNIIKYDFNKTITFRKLWIYINIIGSRLIDFTKNNDLKVSSLKQINFNPNFRSTSFEAILISCEQFSMSKDIISWKNMSYKFFQLFNKKLPLTTIYENKDVIPDLFLSYHQKTDENRLFKYNEKSPLELEEFLIKYDGTKKNKDEISTDKLIDENKSDIGKNYILTPDNFLKIILLIQRMRAHVPIILIGETGCGKTSMIRYLIEHIKKEKLRILNIHSGITDKDIINFIYNAQQELLEKKDKRIWVFFDEINTCDYLDLLSEIICEHKMKGETLPENLLFIGACNPYKTNNDDAIIKVGLYSGKIYSKRNLVYQVNQLPKRLDKYIWEYGELSDIEALKYIWCMLKNVNFVDEQNLNLEKITNLVFQSHKFITKNQPEYKISLRDIHRFKQIYLFFQDFFINFGYENSLIKTKSIILSLYMNYYIKLSSNNLRKKYLEQINSNLDLEDQLEDFLIDTINTIINNLNIPNFYAKNTALDENIFCIFMSIIMKIPLIICGKPGNSKSLSVQLITENLKGDDSKKPFLKNYPKLIPIYYQGSETSTSEGIKKVFEKAKNIFMKKGEKAILPLIVFDEIGLAEISQNNPLKILHSLFDYDLNSQMGFIGISNWALDASKLSRVLYLARPEPDLEDLNLIGLTLFSSFNSILNSNSLNNDNNNYISDHIINALTKSYYEFQNEMNNIPNYENFYGTRDYYALIKLYILSGNLYLSIYRNFGGLSGKTEKMIDKFNEVLNKFSFQLIKDNYEIKNQKRENLRVIDLVKSNLNEHFPILPSYVTRYLLFLIKKNFNSIFVIDHFINTEKNNPFKYFYGSPFKQDLEKDDYKFSILKDIIFSMEKGFRIVLKNLDYIYGALYDLFNQNFFSIGDRKNCRIALGGTNNPMCYVNDKFRCIVISDQNPSDLPPPFLNRFEKHELNFNNILVEENFSFINLTHKWFLKIFNASKIKESKIINNLNLCEVCFLGYNQVDFLYSLALECSKYENKEQKFKELLLSISNINFLITMVISRENCMEENRKEFEECIDLYNKQNHFSIDDFYREQKNKKLTIIYTYSNILENIRIEDIQGNVMKIVEINLNTITSEKEFLYLIETFLENKENPLMIIKVEYNNENNNNEYLQIKINEICKKKRFEKLDKYIYLINYLKPGQSNVNIQFLTNWNQIVIEKLNGNTFENINNLINSTSNEIFKNYYSQKFFVKTIHKILFEINFKFDKKNPLLKYQISNHISNFINCLSEENSKLFNFLNGKTLQLIGNRDKDEWKEFLIGKNQNFVFKELKEIIELYVNEITYPILKDLVIVFENYGIFESFFYGDELFFKIFNLTWNMNLRFKLKNKNEIKFISGLKFPFTGKNLEELFLSTNDNLSKIKANDSIIYNNPQNYSNDIKESYMLSFNNIKESIKSSYLLKQELNLNLKNIEYYYDDIFTFYYYNLGFNILDETFVKIIKNIVYILLKNEPRLEYIFLILMKNQKLFKLLYELNEIKKENDYRTLLEIIEELKSQYFLNIYKYTEDIYRKKFEEEVFHFIFQKFILKLLSQFITSEEQYNKLLNALNSGYISNVYYHQIKFILFYKLINEGKIIKYDNSKTLTENVCLIIENFINDPIMNFNTNEMLQFLKEGLMINNIDRKIKLNLIKKSFSFENLYTELSSILSEFFITEGYVSIDMNNFNSIINNNELGELFNSICTNDKIKSFLIYHMSFYLKIPNKDEFLEYIKEQFKIMKNYLNYLLYENITNYYKIICISFLKYYYKIYSLYCVRLLSEEEKFNEEEDPNNILSEINNFLLNKGDIPLIQNLKIYILKIIISKKSINPSNLLNFNLEKICKITWLPKAQFEIENNLLELNPHLSIFEKERKEVEPIIENLIKEPNEGNIRNFIDFVERNENNSPIKYCILEYIIINNYLSYTNAKFLQSNFLQNSTQLFLDESNNELIEILKKIYTIEGLKYIKNLVSNFKDSQSQTQIDYLSLNEKSKDIGLKIFMNMLYSLYLSSIFGNNNYSFINIFFSNIQNTYSNYFIPGNSNDPQDDHREEIIVQVENDFQRFGKIDGLYECQCGYLYLIGNCTRPMVKEKCPICSIDIGAISKHKLVPTSRCLINVDNRSKVKKENLLQDLKMKLKRNKGYNLQNELFNIRGISEFSICFYSIVFHSFFVFEEQLYDNIYSKIKSNLSKENYLRLHIDNAFETIKNILNDNFNSYIILLHLFEQLIIEGSKDINFETYESRNHFEKKFEGKIQFSIQNFKTISEKFISKYAISGNIYLKILNSTANNREISKYNKDLFPLYTFINQNISYKFSFDWDEIVKISSTQNYHYIILLNKYKDQISLLYNLININALSKYLLVFYNYKLSRKDSKSHLIKEIFTENNIYLWKNFEKSWKNISYGCTQYKCKVLPKLKEMTLDMPVTYLLCDDKEIGGGMYLACAYQFLGQIQNEIIEDIQQCDNTVEFDEKIYPIQMLSKDEIFSFNFKEKIKYYETFFFDFNSSDSSIIYSLEKINNDIKNELILIHKIKKCDYENLDVIQYNYELLSFNLNQHSNFIQIISEEIPQENLEIKLFEKIKEDLSKKPYSEINDIYIETQIVCCQLKFENEIDKNQNLKLYIFSKNISATFLVQLFYLQEILLCNIIDFYELLENFVFENIIETISPDFKKKIENEEKIVKNLEEMFQPENNNIYPSLNQTINAVKRFTVRCLLTDIESKFNLVLYIVRNDFWNISITEEQIDNFSRDFPEEILINNTYELYKILY